MDQWALKVAEMSLGDKKEMCPAFGIDDNWETTDIKKKIKKNYHQSEYFSKNSLISWTLHCSKKIYFHTWNYEYMTWEQQEYHIIACNV